MDKLFIPLIVGTARPKRESIKVGNYVLSRLQQHNQIETELLTPEEFDLPRDGNDKDFQDERFHTITQKADGYVLIVPEYNHSFPGSLKRLLDSEFSAYTRKPVALVGVSSGPWGGVRAIESIIHPLRKMGLVLIQYDLQFPNVAEQFDEQGQIKNSEYDIRTDRLISQFMWYVNCLKKGRDTAAN